MIDFMDELGLRRLRILREVAEHGGVTAAGEAMHYSPSGISQQLSALEHDIGAAVLERRGRGVRLTQVGRVLLEHAEILLSAEREARAAVEHARDSLAVELRVGVFCTAAAGAVAADHRGRGRAASRGAPDRPRDRSRRGGHWSCATATSTWPSCSTTPTRPSRGSRA